MEKSSMGSVLRPMFTRLVACSNVTLKSKIIVAFMERNEDDLTGIGTSREIKEIP